MTQQPIEAAREQGFREGIEAAAAWLDDQAITRAKDRVAKIHWIQARKLAAAIRALSADEARK